MDDLTPDAATIARVDQDLAALAVLVTAAAEHTEAEACPHVGICPGQQAADAIAALPADDRDRLLSLTVAALAQRGYAAAPRYRLTRAGYAALNTQPPDPWPFGGRHA
ncbi:hypothetical protein GCM10029963_53500 [Micromonospora andamanensis]|uniref:hypothetical protein n=1 Tax=Micromonospora andamanensis TaxID=1287068 RepID=UPI00194E5DAF|nr:hypothetical protein [Micromonospora andamanensis]GIJ36711.1 hypothetical protein Vwe01_00360 [Micromonospora andamanensis]